MAEVDSEINLVGLRNFELTVALVFHVDSDKLIADFWSMFSIVCEAELFFLHPISEFWVFFDLNVFTLNLFTPT